MADIEHEDGVPRCDVSDRVLLTTSWDDGNPLDVRIADTLEQFGLSARSMPPRGLMDID